MYKCYRLEYNEKLEELISEYEEIGKLLMENKKESIRKSLEDYLRDDNFIDFTNLQNDWFPTVEADIFISHSHKDIKIINALAGWLYCKFKVKVFVDSYIWNYCDELLREIDEKHCKHSNGESFDYDKRNFSTAHVHMMLANALNKMIYKTECVIFLDTNNSLSVRNHIETGTSSAWIYSELITTSIINRKIPKRLATKEVEIRENFNKVNNSINPLYRVNLEHLVEIDANILRTIANNELEGESPYLDKLYEVCDNKHLVGVLNE